MNAQDVDKWLITDSAEFIVNDDELVSISAS